MVLVSVTVMSVFYLQVHWVEQDVVVQEAELGFQDQLLVGQMLEHLDQVDQPLALAA